jgi:hypothetical protein
MHHFLYRSLFVFVLLTGRTTAAAIILEDIGKSEVVGNFGGRRVKFSRYRRILLLNKSAFDLAKVSISFSRIANDAGKLASIWAVTNNLEDGNIVQSKVERADMFLDQSSSGNSLQTFTFPNIDSVKSTKQMGYTQ